MNIIIYDIALLVIFVIFIGTFLYRRRKNLKREGLLFLYRTSWGIKLINKIGSKLRKTLDFFSYVAIGLGYLLMGAMIYLFGKIIWIYATNSMFVRTIKIPPIMPLIPYIDRIVPGLPPFYFIYFVIIIAIVAVVHEFAHGVFATHRKVNIKNTGFGFFPFFLPVFLAAFVELDEKEMRKKKILPQMSVLAAGTFANVLTAILFFGVMWLFFSLAFAPAGVTFDSYTYSVVGVSAISLVNGIPLQNTTREGVADLVNEEGLTEVISGDEKFLVTQEFLERQQNGEEYILLYDDAPAINAGLEGIITKINEVDVGDRDMLVEELLKYSPEDEVIISTIVDDEIEEFTIILGTHPADENVAYVGIGFANQEASGVMGKIVTTLSLKEANTYYEPKFGAGTFIYNLLWWLVLVNISIALVNMLPVGIFDGGRFFYLTILGITKKEKVAKKAFSIVTYLFLLLLFVVMAFWATSWFR